LGGKEVRQIVRGGKYSKKTASRDHPNKGKTGGCFKHKADG